MEEEEAAGEGRPPDRHDLRGAAVLRRYHAHERANVDERCRVVVHERVEADAPVAAHPDEDEGEHTAEERQTRPEGGQVLRRQLLLLLLERFRVLLYLAAQLDRSLHAPEQAVEVDIRRRRGWRGGLQLLEPLCG